MSIFGSEPEQTAIVPAFVYAEHLTPRELEVIELVAEGQTNPEIAVTLVVTLGTIRTHMGNILGKLHATNRMEAVIAARTLGLIDTDAKLSPIAAAVLILLQTQPSAYDELLALGIFDKPEETP